jgi:deoxyribonuclease V
MTLHSWNVSPSEAISIQQELSHKVKLEPLTQPIKYVAGADISFNKFSEIVYAGIVVLDYKTLKEVDRATVTTESQFPYIPGLLSFREVPPLMLAWQELKIKPDLIILDGQGIAHPRRFGIACHFGLLVNKPAVGCAKSVLIGRHLEPEPKASSWTELTYKNRIIGAALRTKNNVSPIFVSAGHLIDLKSSLEVVLNCCRGYRLPETTRQAHNLVNAIRKSEMSSEDEEITLSLFS